jgi:hypothetical protein
MTIIFYRESSKAPFICFIRDKLLVSSKHFSHICRIKNWSLVVAEFVPDDVTRMLSYDLWLNGYKQELRGASVCCFIGTCFEQARPRWDWSTCEKHHQVASGTVSSHTVMASSGPLRLSDTLQQTVTAPIFGLYFISFYKWVMNDSSQIRSWTWDGDKRPEQFPSAVTRLAVGNPDRDQLFPLEVSRRFPQSHRVKNKTRSNSCPHHLYFPFMFLAPLKFLLRYINSAFDKLL